MKRLETILLLLDLRGFDRDFGGVYGSAKDIVLGGDGRFLMVEHMHSFVRRTHI